MMILVTGSGGMMGSHLTDVFSPDELYCTDMRPSEHVHALDTRDPAAVMRTFERPEMAIHLAAETDVDRCEREVDHAFRSNALGTLNMALACQRFGTELVYVSTAGVFDGAKPEPYTEFDTPAPVNAYARAKYEGEKLVQTLVPRHYIVRAGWMFGGKGKDKKFVAKIASICLGLENGTREIRAVNDKYGNPTYAKDLLQNVRVLMRTGFYGVYHVVNTGSCTRYDVAVEIGRFLQSDIPIVAVPSAMFPLSAPRPRSEAARSYKLELLGLNGMRPWQQALHEYLSDWLVAVPVGLTEHVVSQQQASIT
jgi:dTDP-4-dehydrorhamnose reductase